MCVCVMTLRYIYIAPRGLASSKSYHGYVNVGQNRLGYVVK